MLLRVNLVERFGSVISIVIHFVLQMNMGKAVFFSDCRVVIRLFLLFIHLEVSVLTVSSYHSLTLTTILLHSLPRPSIHQPTNHLRPVHLAASAGLSFFSCLLVSVLLSHHPHLCLTSLTLCQLPEVSSYRQEAEPIGMEEAGPSPITPQVKVVMEADPRRIVMSSFEQVP